MRRKLCRIAALLIVCFASPSFSRDPLEQTTQLKTLRTADLRLIYIQENEHMATYLARCFENSMAFHRELFDYTPSGEVTVLMQDLDDIGYAGATAVPYNWMTIGIEPFEYAYEVSPTNQPINWVMSHELLHVVASDQAAGSDRFFRKLFFGKVAPDDQDPVTLLYGYLTAPRRYAPRWYHEGTATFMETWMSAGIGRVQGGYDEMVFRTMVADSVRFHRLVGLESEGTTTDFQAGANAYLYGTRFVAYCGYRFGPEKVIEWIKRSDGSRMGFSAQFKHVFGRSLGDTWDDWIAWEPGWQETNLDSVRAWPLTRYRELSDKPLGAVSRAYFDPGSRKLYTAVLYPNEPAHIIEIDVDTRESRKITEIRTPTLFYVTWLAFDEKGRRLFFTTDNAPNLRGRRDLHVVDIDTGESKELYKNARTGDLVFDRTDNSVLGILHFNGFSHIVRFPEPYDTFEHYLTLPLGDDIYDIDLSPDGRYMSASTFDRFGDRQLVRYSVDALQSRDRRRDLLLRSYKSKRKADYSNFVHSRDGRYLFGTSYYSGVSNVYRYDLAKRKTEILTNADTGFFRPVPVSDDSLIVFRFTSDGFQPVMIAIEPIDSLGIDDLALPDEVLASNPVYAEEKITVRGIPFFGNEIVQRHPIVESWNIGTPGEINLDSLTIESGDYNDFGNIQLNSIYPIVQSYKSRVAWGLRFNFREPNYLHALEVDALVTPSESLPDKEKGHATAAYMWGRWEFGGTYNKSDFYDFFGPTKTSREGYSLSVKYAAPLIDETPRVLEYKWALAGFGGLKILPFYQNIPTVFFSEYVAAFGQLSYKNTKGTIGGVDKEKGVSWQLNGLLNLINPQEASASSRIAFPQLWLNVNQGFRLPWAHSSLWLRPSVGQSFAPRDSATASLNSFYFGGFGNNWVDHGSVERYREFYAFPGIGLNALGGKTYGKILLEWSLPPVRFSRLGIPSFYLNWAHVSLFTTAITTDFDDNSLRRTLFDVGAQLNVKLVSFFSLPYTFSLGYAAAFEEHERYSDEWMISIKIF